MIMRQNSPVFFISVSTTQLISPDEYNPSRSYPVPTMNDNVPTAPSYGAGAYPGGSAGYPGASGGAYLQGPGGATAARGGGAYPYHQTPAYSPYQTQQQQQHPTGVHAASSQAGYSSSSTGSNLSSWFEFKY